MVFWDGKKRLENLNQVDFGFNSRLSFEKAMHIF